MQINRRVFEIALARQGRPSIAVAREIGIHHSTMSRWVRGWYPVPQQLRHRLAAVLDLSIAELFSEEQSDAAV